MNSSHTTSLNFRKSSPQHWLVPTVSRLVFSALLMLVVLTPIPYGSAQRLWYSAFGSIVFVLAGLWLVQAFSSRSFLTLDQLQLLAPLLALTIYALIQTVPLWSRTTPLGATYQAISSDPHETQLQALKFLSLTFALALLLEYTNTSRRLKLLLHAVIAIALASAIFGVVRQLYQFNPEGFLLPFLTKGSGYAQFINKNHFAFLAEMAFGLIAALIAGRAIAWPGPLIYVALALPIWTAVVLSNSRGGIVAMTSQVVFFALASNIGRAKHHLEPARSPGVLRRATMVVVKLALTAALLAGIVVGMIVVGGEPLADRVRATREELAAQPVDLSNVDRASMWRATLQLCYANPITGVGFGGYWIAITRYHNASGEFIPQQAHNDYLELWASGGLIGVAILIWFVVIFSKQAYRQIRSADRFRRAVALGALTGLFGVAVHSLLDFGLHLTGNAFLSLVLITLATRQIAPETSSRRRPT